MAVRKGYQEELCEIKEQIFQMGEQTTLFITKAVETLVVSDTQGAETIRQCEREIDALHRALEEKCIAIIATQQPVASDLRFLIAAIKISGEIERIADYANNIAMITHKNLSVLDLSPVDNLKEVVSDMGNLVVGMMSDTFQAYASKNYDFVTSVKERDGAVNAVNTKLLNLMIDTGRETGNHSQVMFEMHAAVRYLERAADRTVNIAKWLFYMGTGFRYIKPQKN